MNSDMTVQTEVTLQNTGSVSDLGPHKKVVQIRIKNNSFHVVCPVHTVMEKKVAFNITCEVYILNVLSCNFIITNDKLL